LKFVDEEIRKMQLSIL